MTSLSRIAWVDRMRGLAILSVVVQHLAYNFQNEFVYRNLIGISNMGVFFFVSGYILNKTTHMDGFRATMNFLFKKTVQLMLPFLVWGLLVNRYFFQDSWTAITVLDIENEFLNPHLWFLLTLYGYCFLFAGYKVVSNLVGGGKFTLLYWIIVIIIMFVVWYELKCLKMATLYVIYFAVGVFISKIKRENLFANQLFTTVSLLMIFLLLAFWTSGSTSLLNIAVKIVVSFSVIQITYRLCTEMKWYKPWDTFILSCGKNSIAIYVVHWTFLHFFDKAPMMIQNELFSFIIMLIGGVLISVTCLLFHRIVRLSPILDMLMFGRILHKK